MDIVQPGALRDLSAIVICGEDLLRIDAALAGLLAHARGLDLDVVVVEGSEEGGGGRIGTERVEPAGGTGFARACNRGLDMSCSRYALFMDAGVDLREGSLRALVSALDAQPDVGLAGVRELFPDGTVAPTIRRFPSPYHLMAEALGAATVPGLRRLVGERRFGARLYGGATPCDWTAGSVLIARRAALDSAGWFDERLLPDAARADICLRLRRAGWRVVHMPQLTTRQRGGDRRRSAEAESAYARMQFVRKHLPLAAGGHRWALLFRYGLRVGADSLLGRRTAAPAEGARAALATVLSGRVPLGRGSAVE